MILDLNLPPIHPIVGRFPEVSADELDRLTADIAEHGQRRPVGLYQGCIWDGRARVEACKRLMIQPRYWLLRRGDPVVFLIARNARFGLPRSAERDAALTIFNEMDTVAAKEAAKKHRSDWLSEARREFRLTVKRHQPCAVCDQHLEMVHAHHSLPLNIQYELGLWIANQEHDWLCPVHHWMVHVYISIYVTCTKPGDILDNIHSDRQPEWLKAEEVFRKGQDLFQKFGGLNHDRAEWNDKYPEMAMR